MQLVLSCGDRDKKSQPRGGAGFFSQGAEKVRRRCGCGCLLLFRSSRRRGGSRGSFSGLGGFGGSSSRGGRCSRCGGRGRGNSRCGGRGRSCLFLFATGGNGEGEQGGNEERLFHFLVSLIDRLGGAVQACLDRFGNIAWEDKTTPEMLRCINCYKPDFLVRSMGWQSSSSSVKRRHHGATSWAF